MKLLAGLMLAAAVLVSSALGTGVPTLEYVRLDRASGMQDLGFISLGMRRQAADLHFVRLLQYYGTLEGEAAQTHGEAGHVHIEGEEYGGGSYPEILPRTLRILELDPYFRYAAIYAAGALAFNLKRPEEAVSLLRTALQRDPKAWQYHLYIAAIAYRQDDEFGKLVEVLEPALADPECPAMLKVMAAGVYQKLGNTDRAVALYLDVARESRDEEYRKLARRRVEALLKKPRP